MQLPDEMIEYHFQGTVAPAGDAWTALAEVQAQQLLPAGRLRALLPQLQQARSQLGGRPGICSNHRRSNGPWTPVSSICRKRLSICTAGMATRAIWAGFWRRPNG